MGKGHRDNHAARLKRGDVAFAKKALRRAVKYVKCVICGCNVHIADHNDGMPCKRCQQMAMVVDAHNADQKEI